MKTFKTQFISFYSYKGGVGRTSALINTALIMAMKGERVVVLDFDLEAPGLFSYVMEIAEKYNISKEDVKCKRGILEYLHDSINKKTIPELRKYSISNDKLNLNIQGKIWILGAGDTSKKDYSKKLNSLDWTKIFEESHGEALLENFKKQIISEFENPDYVFIDSRTGITDIGGVCTKYLSDLVVVLSSLNRQNILGTSEVVSSFKKSYIDTILVASNIPVGLPWGENQLFQDRIEKFSKFFEQNPDLLIYHYPSLSLTEYLPSLFKLEKSKVILQEDPLLLSYENLAHTIESKNSFNFKRAISEVAIKMRFSEDQKTSESLKEELETLRKNYSNRIPIIDLLDKIIQAIDLFKDKDIKIKLDDKSTLKLISYIKNFLDEYKFEIDMGVLPVLRNMILHESSAIIYKIALKNVSDLIKNSAWFDILTSHHKNEIVKNLIKNKHYEFVIKNLKEEKNTFFIFSRGYSAEQLEKKALANELYNAYVEKIEERRFNLKSPETAFVCAYAFYKLGNNAKALEYIKISNKLLLIHDDGNEYFVPTLFREVEGKDNFLKELNKFENNNLNSVDK
ncbi:KGGVGR-motif variant AAA ATPase [Candidatus Berkiella aquae]|uniref:AAA family ATPase n=1 Tax=Candidatus Berkiella aquae TaxID=295108 RepID=A0A0Q9YNP3_9GAMM|nr:AAA family ATPase [Candidatus Berkiella aquae]MCS5712378.1 AAA family ATPase [Candidatus Berkiella aquae]